MTDKCPERIVTVYLSEVPAVDKDQGDHKGLWDQKPWILFPILGCAADA